MGRSIRIDLSFVLAMAIVARFSCIALSNIPIFTMSFTFIYILAFCILTLVNHRFTKIEFIGMLLLTSYVIEVALITVPVNGLLNTHAFNAYVIFALYCIYLYQKRIIERRRRTLLCISFVGFGFTYAYSIFMLMKDPLLSRRAASSYVVENSVDTLQAIGGFDTVYGGLLIFVMLLFIVIYGGSKYRKIYLALMLSCGLFIVMATYATAIVILVSILVLFLYQRNRVTAVICLLTAVGFVLCKEAIGRIIIEFSQGITYSSTMQEKLYQIGYMLQYGESVGTLAGEEGRFARMGWSLKSFIASPLFGSYANASLPIGCHSEVFDTLGRFGLWGFFSLVGFYVCCFKDIAASLMYKETHKCLIIVIVVYLITCVLDPGLYTQQIFPIFILLPLMELGYSDRSHIVGGNIL